MTQNDKKKDQTVLRKIEPKPRIEDPKETAIARVTNSKYVGGKWYYLTEGKEVVAPQSIMRSFRRLGFVF